MVLRKRPDLHAREQVGVSRILFAVAVTPNLLRAGPLDSRLEGEKRRGWRCMADGEFKDECMTGILMEEWKKE
jgi:hypothetical protein